jgi:hypothetical protein
MKINSTVALAMVAVLAFISSVPVSAQPPRPHGLFSCEDYAAEATGTTAIHNIQTTGTWAPQSGSVSSV